MSIYCQVANIEEESEAEEEEEEDDSNKEDRYYAKQNNFDYGKPFLFDKPHIHVFSSENLNKHLGSQSLWNNIWSRLSQLYNVEVGNDDDDSNAAAHFSRFLNRNIENILTSLLGPKTCYVKISYPHGYIRDDNGHDMMEGSAIFNYKCPYCTPYVKM